MKFLVDAQLPKRVCRVFADYGYDSVHTSDLAGGNRTPDSTILSVARAEVRTVITKDTDFVASHIAAGSPARLLPISTGNIRNDDLIGLIAANIGSIISAFATNSFVEVTRNGIIVR